MTPTEVRALTFEEHAVMEAYMAAALHQQGGGGLG